MTLRFLRPEDIHDLCFMCLRVEHACLVLEDAECMRTRCRSKLLLESSDPADSTLLVSSSHDEEVHVVGGDVESMNKLSQPCIRVNVGG